MKFPVDLGLVLSSIAASELARLRRRSILDDDLWSIGPDTRFGDAALPLDSIELLSLAAAVSEMFHLAESGAGDYLLRYRSIAEWREIVAQAWLSERITFRTSGSTGEPKKCAHRTSDLRAELQVHAARFPPPESGMPGRVVSCVPAHHIYGFLFTAMLPCTLGIPVVRSRGIPQLAPRDLVIAAPYVWRYVDRTIDHFPAHTFGVTSGAPCPNDLFSSLTRKGLDLTEIYGSSETAGVGSRTVAGAPFELLANRPALPEVPDEIEMVATRRFRVLGRKDGAVQVAGVNVFPALVSRKIAEHPEVRECAIRKMNGDEGERLKAFIVWRDAPVPAAEFEAWLMAKLAGPERPAMISSGPALPRGESGKLSDWPALSTP